MGVPQESEKGRQLAELATEQLAQRHPGEPVSLLGGDGRVVSLEDGTGAAFGARVNDENNIGVEARYGRNAIVTTYTTVGTTAAVLVSATDKRLQVTIQNLHDVNLLFINLGGTPVVGQDLMLPPGGMFSLPPGVAYEGAISGIASAADTDVVVVEYRVQG
jgi:hypothetical protein